MAAVTASDEVVEFNVGGRIFSSLRSTLCSEGGSMLARKFDPASPFRGAALDSAGRPFVDRDGDVFATVLKFLRNRGSLPKPHEMSAEELAELNYEAEYFCLDSLKSFVETELKTRREEEAKRARQREEEEYQEKRKKICRKFGYHQTQEDEDEEMAASAGKDYACVICNVDEGDVGEKISRLTTLEGCGNTGMPKYEVHSVVPILQNGSTIKLCALLVADEMVKIPGPTDVEQVFLDGGRIETVD